MLKFKNTWKKIRKERKSNRDSDVYMQTRRDRALGRGRGRGGVREKERDMERERDKTK